MIYKAKGEKMKSLFSADFKLCTVHVEDLCRAIVFLKDRPGTYNIADPNVTTLKYLNKLIETIFRIKTGYHTRFASLLSPDTLAEAANDIHMPTWMDLCAEFGIDTPISPEMDSEDVQKMSVNADGRAINRLGFEYQYPAPTVEVLRQQAAQLCEAGLLPPI
mmetsp:Transcript_26545/g.47677  ORF Transcript_26545/g.47677 Transcript_26545/m.47677 type:complete len:162 (+) Transcript_26545:568-1053(+)